MSQEEIAWMTMLLSAANLWVNQDILEVSKQLLATNKDILAAHLKEIELMKENKGAGSI